MNTYFTDEKFIRFCRRCGIKPNQSDYEYYLAEYEDDEDDTEPKDLNPDN